MQTDITITVTPKAMLHVAMGTSEREKLLPSLERNLLATNCSKEIFKGFYRFNVPFGKENKRIKAIMGVETYNSLCWF